jgi:hypothetical protein
MNYQEKFELNENNAFYFSKQFDILITGLRDELDERHLYFKKMLTNFKGLIYSFDICENAERFYYRIEDFDGKIIEKHDNKSLIPELQSLLRNKRFQGAKVCVDITTLKQGILFLLTKLFITEIKPARFFAAYTEPKNYKKKSQFDIGETEEFDLYDKIIGSSHGVPGFIKQQSLRDILLLAPMGFASQRLQTIYENLKPKRMIPIVGFPSFVPGWNITAIKMNYMVLKSADCCDMVKPCEAASPFELYELLNEEFHRNNQFFDIYIAPLGTRPHCLGAAIFVAKNPSTYLIYDFPVEKKYRSESILKANFYNLSKFIA